MTANASVERTVTGLGYALVDIERTPGGLLRVFIDRIAGQVYPAGGGEFVTVEDCEAVTRQLQYVLEVDQVDYQRLEVSSPGLDRPLKSEADYARFAGQAIQLTLAVALKGRKKYKGILQAREGSWALLVSDEKQDQVLEFSFADVREARLEPVVNFKGRSNPSVAPAPERSVPVGGRNE